MSPGAPVAEPRELTRHYERARNAALGGGSERPVGVVALLRQGMWAFIALGPANREPSETRGSIPARLHTVSQATAAGSELLSTWTDLLIAQVTEMETR